MHELAQHPGFTAAPTIRSKSKGQTSHPSSNKVESNITPMSLTLGALDALLAIKPSDTHLFAMYQYFQVAHVSLSLVKIYLRQRDSNDEVAGAQIDEGTVDKYLNDILHSWKVAEDVVEVSGTTTDISTGSLSIEQRLYDTIGTSVSNGANVPPEPARSFGGFTLLLQKKLHQDKERSMCNGNGQEKSATANRALHLLSEVAMGNTGQAQNERAAQGQDSAVPTSAEGAMEKLFKAGEQGMINDNMVFNVIQRIPLLGMD